MNRFFLIGGVILPLLLILSTLAIVDSSGKDRAYELWDFYNEYIRDMDFMFPVNATMEVTGNAYDGLRFIARATWSDLGDNYYKVNPDSALFYTENYPCIVFNFKLLSENIVPLNDSQGTPDLTYPILSLTHHHGQDVILLIMKINPDQVSAETVTFSWLRARINATEFFFESMDVVEGAGTTILLDPGYTSNYYLKIGIIPAIWSERQKDPSGNEYYNAIFGFYTVIEYTNTTTGNTESTGFGIAWKSLKFYASNFTEFKRWMEEFREWWIDLGISHFARTDQISISDYYYVSNFDYNSSSAEFEFKNIAIYNLDIDYNNLYADLQAGLLPEYEYTSLIDLTSEQVYSLNMDYILYLLLYVVSAVTPYIAFKRNPFLGAFIAVILIVCVFNFMFNDYTFLLLGSICVLGMWLTWGVEGR